MSVSACLERWIRIPARGLESSSGLTRPFLYELIRAGEIKSASLKRKPGALRGVRVIWLPSLMAYIERFAEGGRKS